MSNPFFRSAAGICLATALHAGVIIAPQSASSPQGSFIAPFGLTSIINQSGLSSAYVSGVTDFASYTASATHNSVVALNSGFTSTSGDFPQTITFDLGSVLAVGGLAFWSTVNLGTVTEFTLFADSDTVFGNGTTSQLGGTFNTLADGGIASPAQVFSFQSFSTQYVHLQVLNTGGGLTLFPGIGELAFDSPATILEEVPEPATWSVILTGLLAVAGLRRRMNGKSN